MHLNQFASETAVATRFDYEDRTVFAIDFGEDETVSVDILDGTAIIVSGNEQQELTLPSGTVDTVNNNGVLTIEVRE